MTSIALETRPGRRVRSAIELRHRGYFVAVAGQLHLGRAVERLHLAPLAVTAPSSPPTAQDPGHDWQQSHDLDAHLAARHHHRLWARTGHGHRIQRDNALYRFGVRGDRERDDEERARAFFDKQSYWPAEDPPPPNPTGPSATARP